MTEASIPVDLFNPGQVFASLGFLEAADVLLGDAEGGFDWSDAANVRFTLRTAGREHPFEAVLEFLANATVVERQPSDIFPGPEDDEMARPIFLRNGDAGVIEIGHWADGSSRNGLKLYAGNRAAFEIAKKMVQGNRKEPKKNQAMGDVETKGIAQLWAEQRAKVLKEPFDVLTPLGGKFNFDPRGAWTAIDAGYSPNDQQHGVAASPVVELLAAVGLEHARPNEYEKRHVRYGAWPVAPPILARASLTGDARGTHSRIFQFELALSGKNKIVTFAKEA